MPTNDDLDAAVSAGVLSIDQAGALAEFLAVRRGSGAAATNETSADDENVHFVRGFHDIFMTIGVGLLLSGIALLGTMSGSALAGALLALAVAWGLAEYLTGYKRLVLPSIVLVIAISIAASVVGGSAARLLEMQNALWPVLTSAAMSVGAVAIFYWRFLLPFAMAVLFATFIVAVFSVLVVAVPDFTKANLGLLILLAGGGSFAAAMWQDLKDPKRRTLRSDNAFWLHLIAAPMIVHALIWLLIGANASDLQGPREAAIVIGIVAVLSVVAILVDRRALLVSGLAYVGFALARLVRETELSALGVTALTLVILGAGVVALGSGWHPVRRLLLHTIPAVIGARLPPAKP